MLETIVGLAVIAAVLMALHGGFEQRAIIDRERRLRQRVAMAREAEETRLAIKARLPLD